MNDRQKRDVEEFARTFELAGQLGHSVFLITGTTGHIGSSLVHCLLALRRGVRIVAPVRSISKAQGMFSREEMESIDLIECDIAEYDYGSIGAVDYIIHCAAPTDNRAFVACPVDTFDAILKPTQALLQYSCSHPVKAFVFLSSLEVYGTILDDTHLVTEDCQGPLEPMSVRSSYPMAKRAVETLCHLYAAQYGVPARVARLPQTIGAGVSRSDRRVLAEFCRLAAEGRDIVLHTSGESARTCCYVTDAVSAILYILLRGVDGEAYNIGDEGCYISARDMARVLKEQFNSSIDVRIELADNNIYPPVAKLRLSSRKISSLGWKPRCGLHDTFRRLIEYFREP